ncbi:MULTISPECIES: hydrogenase formation protein HypD [unclassified Paludibacterium]|uniref:hydrogenase formation protein HypD n=1 Tax=unclassified Paludibacterium TaxID=2618429 RepID=UPI001C04078B|nr:hydrogenase formation protein HypD [Paludibacterium sp. B53371]BEV70869.1 hydrogenase formation protein HypD [Paludibacterium sp. THUN1379]
MKYIDEFRDGELAQRLARTIAAEVRPGRSYRLMEFCGGHTHAISRYGLQDLLPPQVRMIHGPGCPVCVLPIGRIDSAIELAVQHQVILCTYADTLRVPASGGMSLYKARARGADVRMVYSCDDALALAEQHPDRQVVFFAIGFETTTPPTAAVIRKAAARGVQNFSVFCNHVLTPAAMVHIMQAQTEPDAVALDGFVGPAHVSTVIGYGAYQAFAERYHKPVVIAGFEPLDVMQAILMLVRQLNEGRAQIENQFTRAVSREGNLKAQGMVAEVFTLRDAFDWRGLGEVPASALRIRDELAAFDAERRFGIGDRQVPDHKACECAAILRGQKRPQDCKVFGTVCTPDHPIGACMVSSEGACAAHYTYGRFRTATQPDLS